MSDKLLNEIIESLQQNGAIQAAWLAGSRGRGTSDEFSDIDIWVAIEDVAIQAVVDDPLGFVHTIVPTIMHINAPSIAPAGGAFLGSWVPGDGVFCQVDWYFTPASTARRDSDTHLMFGDVAIHEQTKAPSLEDEYIAAKVNDNLVMALQRINLMVKRARRGFTWGVSNAARNADRNLVTADVLMSFRTEPQFAQLEKTFLLEPVPSLVDEIQTLANHLLDVVTDIAGRADVLPMHQAAISAMRALVDSWRETGWKPTGEYYRTLPKRYVGAGVLFTDVNSNVLLLETTYKQFHEIPGGVVEAGESPHVAAKREVKEELGLDIALGRLLVFDSRNQPAPKGDAIMLVFDGGVINDPTHLRPDGKEIDRFHFEPIDLLDRYCTQPMVTRIQTAMRARQEQCTIHIDNGEIIG